MATEDSRPGKQLWLRAISFLNAFDPSQVRYAANEWHDLLEFVSKAPEIENKVTLITQLTFSEADRRTQPFLAVRAFRNVILRIDPASSKLTVAHVYLTRVCLLARAYKLALPVIDQTIFAIPSAADNLYPQRTQYEPENGAATRIYSFEPPAKLTCTDHLRYFLYGGMIYMALKEWGKARHFLSIVISSPAANAISLIMVEAYKKWILVNLLENGTVRMVHPSVCFGGKWRLTFPRLLRHQRPFHLSR